MSSLSTPMAFQVSGQWFQVRTSVLPGNGLSPRTSRPVHTGQSHRVNIIACSPAPTDQSVPREPSTTSPASESLEPPPNTFYQAITQAQSAVNAALDLSHTLLEIEFPPLPTKDMESPSIGSYEVSNANLRLAVDFAKRYANEGKQVVLSFPDRVERDRVENDFGAPENIRLSCLRDSRPGWLIERIWTTPKVEPAVLEDDDMFIVLGASCQELPDVEKLVEAAGSRPVILFNLKLDTARGDLGLPAFPRRDLHYRFLSKVLPVYYLRTRTYSRSMTRPPYVINYSGALYRVFPGPYQILLDTSAGSYRRLTTMKERPALGEVRDILTEGMNLEAMSNQEKKSFLYRGYKSKTWWEEDKTKATSNKWRS